MFSMIFFFLFIHLTLSEQWYSKSQCTQKEFANHMDIHCNSNELILIGWSHYGTKKRLDGQFNSSSLCQPAENDCIMDYTHKIAELCNGISKCEVILTQQFIHKCSDEATYLFISYQCIRNSSIVDICSKRSLTTSNSLNIISPMFPNEYPNNVNCTCSIESKRKDSTIMIDVENLSFNLQDNDRLLTFSGNLPFGASLFTGRNQFNLKFQTDEMLSQSGFWIRLYGYQQCQSGEFTLGSKCLKIFSKKQNCRSAEEICASLNSNLLHLHDVIEEKKLAYFLSNTNEQYPTSFWISNEKENYDVHSWWPWRVSSMPGKCLLRTSDGWMKRACNEEQAFICQRDEKRQRVPLTIRCGDIQQPTIISSTTTIIETTRMVSSSTMKSVTEKTNTIDPNILGAIVAGISMVIFAVNIVICLLYRKRIQTSAKTPVNNNSNSSFTHEELQRSLMQHLYHEQTNTISSTSSHQSQSKSNDTTTTNLFQIPPPPPTDNLCPTTLYFRNPHINSDQVDYHVYETIPSENLTYTVCTNHSAFKPTVQSLGHRNQSYLPRTNILYSHPDSYKTLSKIPNNTTVVMPVCCHHYPTGTLGQPQIYTRSESIV